MIMCTWLISRAACAGFASPQSAAICNEADLASAETVKMEWRVIVNQPTSVYDGMVGVLQSILGSELEACLSAQDDEDTTHSHPDHASGPATDADMLAEPLPPVRAQPKRKARCSSAHGYLSGCS